MLSVALLLVTISFLYTWLKWNFSYWKRNEVPGPEPSLFFGNLKSTLIMTENPGIAVFDWYNKYPDEPYVGYYKLFKPAVLLRSIELIKDVLTTNFDSFRNNDINVNERYDPLFSKNPVAKRDDDWKEARRVLSPLFSPNKLKMVVPVMDNVAGDFIKYIKSYPARTDLNAKDIAVRYTTEAIIKSIFSIEPGCFDNEKDSEFLSVPKIITPSFLTALKGLAIAFWPDLIAKCIPVAIIPRAIDRWFRRFVRTHMKSRSDSNGGNSKLEDLFETLRQIQHKMNYDDTFLESNSFNIFLDGSETSAVVMSYVLYELARNPHCQEKAHEEVDRILSKHNGRSTYEAIMEMDYLGGVLLEAARLHPPNLFLVKRCTKRYTLPKNAMQNKPIAVEPGTTVLIPTYAIHMDPKNYPDPEVFEPERFGDNEQLHNPKCAYFAFGVGARACLGMRLAMFQIKVALAHIVLNFRIMPSPLQQPLVIEAKSVFSTYPKDGIFVQFEAR